MNETLQTIYTRRSVRAFDQTRDIPVNTLNCIADAARYAPTARGIQKLHFTVIADRAKIAALAWIVGAAVGRDSYDFYKPSALMLVSYQKIVTTTEQGLLGRTKTTESVEEYPFAVEDTACALQTSFLAAASMGIGSVWINQLRGLEDENVRTALTRIGIPESHAVTGTAAFGYPADENALKAVPKVTGRITIVR